MNLPRFNARGGVERDVSLFVCHAHKNEYPCGLCKLAWRRERIVFTTLAVLVGLCAAVLFFGVGVLIYEAASL